MSANFSKNPLPAADSLPDLPLGGITPFTTIDFPGRLAAVLFTQGCPWRCGYCFNVEFQPFEPGAGRLDKARVLDFLEARRGLLDGIVFSGGEAAAHESLPEWMSCIKRMGFAAGLHTAGIYPERLKKALPFCDWVGLDVKAPFDDYERVTKVPGSGEKVRESAELVLKSRAAYEFRTTVHPDLLSSDDLLTLALEIHSLGARNFTIQVFKSSPQIGLPSCAGWTLPLSLKAYLTDLFPALRIR